MTTGPTPIPFDRSRLRLAPLCERRHNLDLAAIKPLAPADSVAPELAAVAACMHRARDLGAAVVLMMGAHVLRDGVQRFLIDMMANGLISCIAVNGAGVIHDYEFALIGATTESVSRYIGEGRFGMWRELEAINRVVAEAAVSGDGLGEAVGRHIHEAGLPHGEVSVLAAAHRLGVPVTVHVGIGYDIVHQLPNCDGAAYGATSYTDFLRFAGILDRLQDGVVMNFGSAVMGPEIFLKALSMARNAAGADGRRIHRFATLVCDLHRLPATYREEPDAAEPLYYYRPWKTMLARTVADGGTSYYVRGRHQETVPQLWTALNAL